MIARKIELGLITKRRIDQGMMTAIGQTKIDGMIIKEMIDMTMIDGIIEIIRQEMIEMTGGHTKVTDIMMIEGGMTITDMIIVDFMMTEEMIIDDPKDLDNFNIILRVEMMQNHNMFGRHSMKRENLVDQRCQIAIFAGKMVTMQINAQQRTKEKHP